MTPCSWFRLAAAITIDAAENYCFGTGNRRIIGAGHVRGVVLAASDAESDAVTPQLACIRAYVQCAVGVPECGSEPHPTDSGFLGANVCFRQAAAFL